MTVELKISGKNEVLRAENKIMWTFCPNFLRLNNLHRIFAPKNEVQMKRMILSDESINSYGFWVLTEGISMERFLKNPIMLFNHHRTSRGKTDEILPIGRWENLTVENGVLYGTPVFDEKDEFAMKIRSKLESGILSSCSIGISVKTWSEDVKYLKPGQQYPTAVACELMEVSIVDIPSNPNAAGGLILYDDNENMITLADGTLPEGIINKLNSKKMSEKIALKLGLPTTATVDEIILAIDKVGAAKDTEIATLKAELKTLKDEKAQSLKAQADTLINEAVQDGRIDAKAKEKFEKLFESDFEGAKTILESISKRNPMGAEVTNNVSDLEKLSWDELDKLEKLAELKAKDPALYEKKYNEKFNKKD